MRLFFANSLPLGNTTEKYGFCIDGVKSDLLKLLNREYVPQKGLYSSLVPFLAEITRELIQKLAVYLKGIFEFDYSIVNETDSFLVSVYESLRQRVESEAIDLVELTHISNDSSYIGLLTNYIMQTIECYTNLSLTQKMDFSEHFERLKGEALDKIMDIVPK